MTTKEKAIQVIKALPEDATLSEIVEKLQSLDQEAAAEPDAERQPAVAEGGVWDLLEQAAGRVEMSADWASEHDHFLYGTPKRYSAD